MHARTPEPGVRDAEDLEQLLDGAVLAVAAVQGEKRDVGLVASQPRDQVRPDVDGQRLMAETLERLLDAAAGSKRHLPLERAAALEDGDPH